MRNQRTSCTWMALVLAATVGCSADQAASQVDDDEQDPAALQALLRDAPLNHLEGAVDSADARSTSSGAPASMLIAPGVDATGIWDFDQCSAFRTNLFDGTFHDNTAFRSVGVQCGPGIQNSQGVVIAATEDLVYVPDQPSFGLDQGVTVAGWFKPTATSGTRTLFRKRDKGTSSFALLLNAGRFQFIIGLAGGRAISLTAPQRAKVDVFQHVAATYDGTTARLYVEGLEVRSFAATGTIPPGPGPLLMGNDGSERRFSGTIDSTLFASHALTADQVLALNCFPQRPSLTLTPHPLPDTPAGVPLTMDVALTNHNPPACAPLVFTLETETSQTGVTLDPPAFTFVHSAPIASGDTAHMTVSATATDDTDTGTPVFFQLLVTEPITAFSSFEFLDFTVAPPIGCHVSSSHELMIKNVSVVDDPVRATFDPASSDPRNGVWSFKHLVEAIAPTPQDAPAMIEAMLTGMLVPQTINGFTVEARPALQRNVLDQWPRTASGALDLARAPLRLQAIVNRLDLRDLDHGDAGEVRFVFAFNHPSFQFESIQAMMNFEYKLPATTEQDVRDWANAFHGLGALPFGEDYNAALQQITERFAGRGARPDHTKGSALSAVRTNEAAFSDDSPWQLRSFALSATSGWLEPVALDRTPDRSFDGGATLASYVTANQAAILADRHSVPALFAGQPFQAGAVFNDLTTWSAPGIDSDTRHHFAINTCNGCHSLAETNTPFTQISPRFAFSEATLSPFLTGTTVSDPITGQSRTFNDLARRRADLDAIVCADAHAATGTPPTSLRKGISRVH